MSSAPTGFAPMKTIIGIVALLALVALFAYAHFVPIAQPAAAAAAPQTVRWLLTHQPTAVFARASQVFAQTLEKESHGTLVLSVITPNDISINAQGDVPTAEVIDLLNSGKAELASTYTVALGQKDPAFLALNLPFLFSSYADAPSKLDGKAGQSILGGLQQAKGLAFTMSGGFRIIASKTKISSPSGLKGLRVATSGGAVAEATLKALGATPVAVDLESGSAAIDPSKVDAVETTYSRLALVVGQNSPYAKYVYESDHSMFLTAIVAGNSFYNSLSPENQAALTAAAQAAALVERQDSIALGEQTKTDLIAGGSVISVPSAADTKTMSAATAPVYEQFTAALGAALVQALSH